MPRPGLVRTHDYSRTTDAGTPSATNGRLGLGGSATTSNATTAQGAVTDARCAAGSTALGNGTCSLKPNTTYYYRVKFTLDGNTATNGDWTGLRTS